jgi:hypothetical protein
MILISIPLIRAGRVKAEIYYEEKQKSLQILRKRQE